MTRAGLCTLCFGCRALTNVPRSASDFMPTDTPPGMKWERFTCERCGIEDVRLVDV